MLQTLFKGQELVWSIILSNMALKNQLSAVFQPRKYSKSKFSGNDDWHLAFSDFCLANQVEPNIKVGANSSWKGSEKVGVRLTKFWPRI